MNDEIKINVDKNYISSLKKFEILQIKLVIKERYFEKNEIIRIGQTLYVTIDTPIKVENGYEYLLEPVFPISATFVTDDISSYFLETIRLKRVKNS